MPEPALFATWLGYITALAALAALAVASAALLGRRQDLERLTPKLLHATALAVSAATMVALAVHQVAPTRSGVYVQLFLAASLFTLALALADWRRLDSEVLWKVETRWLYLGWHLGCLSLALALIGMG